MNKSTIRAKVEHLVRCRDRLAPDNVLVGDIITLIDDVISEPESRHEKALRHIVEIGKHWQDSCQDGMNAMANTAKEALGINFCTRSMYHDNACNGLPNKGCLIWHNHRDVQEGTGICLDCGLAHPRQPITARKI